jgi:phosphoribosylformylglycinamidine synthase subunit PurQ / glutaminase
MKFGVLVFPGSNCDHDTYNVIEQIAHQPVTMLWHESEDLEGCDAILVPGGFAYGDYLRTGAIAHFAPVMQSVKRFAASGGLVLGICNGFQILCESGLLPGALMRNAGLKYICKQVHLRTETTDSPFTNALQKGHVLQIPIGHMEGNYFCDESTLAALQGEDRIAFRYATPSGEITADANPNGSLDNIAGVLNEGRNVLGMMPHPDRSSEVLLGSADGFPIFQSMIQALSGVTPSGIAMLSGISAGIAE